MTQTFQEQANREVRNKRPVWKIFQIYAVVPRLFARAPSPFHNVYFLQTILHPRWVTYFLNAPITYANVKKQIFPFYCLMNGGKYKVDRRTCFPKLI